MIEVFAIKHVSDQLRREPRNVGVIVRDTTGIRSRFLGEMPDGRIHGRNVQMPGDIYGRWIEFYRHHLSEGMDKDIARLRSRRPLDFYHDLVATMHDNIDLREALDLMYPQVITEPQDPNALTRFEQRVEHVFTTLGVMPSRETRIVGNVSGEPYECEFEYGVQGNQFWLMDRIALPENAKSARRNANDFAFRAQAVTATGEPFLLAAFVDSSRHRRSVEEHLRAVEKYAQVIDLADEERAVVHVGELLRA